MVGSSIVKRLGAAFPGSFVNTSLEFIAHKEANQYFRLEDCNTELEVKCKILEWLSRGAHKTCPYASEKKNDKFHAFMLEGINAFLLTDFDEKDITLIYQRLGNRVRHGLTMEFVLSGYNMALLEVEE